MHDALAQLATVFADPGASDAAKVLDRLRKRWKTFDADERAALAPLAKLAADRVAAAEAAARPSLFDLAPAEPAPQAAAVEPPAVVPAPAARDAERPAPPSPAVDARPAAAPPAPALPVPTPSAPTPPLPRAPAPAASSPDHDTLSPAEEAYLASLDALDGDDAGPARSGDDGAFDPGSYDATPNFDDPGSFDDTPVFDDPGGFDSTPVFDDPGAFGDAPGGGRSSFSATGSGASASTGSRSTASPAGPAPDRAPLDHVDPDSLLHLLGLESFRPGQREAVEAALHGRDSLVVMPTGGGKSLCYQLPALAGDDLTVVVSPLIALMRDQCARLTDLGHPAVMLASGGDGASNRQAIDEVRDGTAKVCFAAPERFASGVFRNALRTRAIALFVVDEAHCVSEWGHDFRPDYLRLSAVIEELGRPPVMACTATATPKVADEIVSRLELRTATRVRSGFDRPNLSFDVLPFDGQGSVAKKKATLVAGVSDPANRPAIVYCGTRKSTEEVCDLLNATGVTAVGYHAGMSADVRASRQDAFMRGQAEVVVATNAFGMGVDKADVRSVWHWALPSSLEAYYQEAGRAGRDGALSRAVLLASRSDLGRLVRFINEAEVTVEQVGGLVGRLRAQADQDGVVDADAGQDRDRIALAIAERAGAIELAPGPGGRLRVRVHPGGLDHGRVAQMCRAAKDRRWQAYRSIEKYAAGDNEVCRRRQLLDHFGDPEDGAPLGRCCDVHDPVDWLPPIQVASGRSRGGSSQAEETGRPVSDDELAPLKAWRRERADGKPAYTVATDKTLREVVRQQPSTPDELGAISGIGPSFLQKHGDALLELLRG